MNKHVIAIQELSSGEFTVVLWFPSSGAWMHCARVKTARHASVWSKAMKARELTLAQVKGSSEFVCISK